jgi:hypothetical protein
VQKKLKQRRAKMKKMFLAVMLVICMVSAALAEDYIAVVGNDSEANSFYFSFQDLLNMHDQNQLGVLVCDPGSLFPDAYNMPYHPSYGAGCEQFRSNSPVIQPEVCDVNGKWHGVRLNPQFEDGGNKNARVSYSSAGWYEWYVRLPVQPTRDIRLVLRCGVLMANEFAFLHYDSVKCPEPHSEDFCYAYTGADVDKSGEIIENSMIIGTLPKITAKAYPGPNSTFAPFILTARSINGWPNQLLNGSPRTRIVLESCTDTEIVVAMPTAKKTLEAGDLIYLRMDIPNHVKKYTDLYCHEQSLKVMGLEN